MSSCLRELVLGKKHLLGCSGNIPEFAAATVLLRLQWATGFHIPIDRDWVTDPLGHLRPFLNWLYDSSDTRADLLEMSIKYCNEEYHQARSALKAALTDESWVASSRKLRFAYHGFRIVNFFRRFFEIHEIWPTELEFSPVLVEEALACTINGITSGAIFCALDPEKETSSLLRRLDPDMWTFPSLRDFARRDASEFRPVFTRCFADILAAQALTLLTNPTNVREGIARLEEIRHSFRALETDFERGWIDHALLKAYGKLNDDEAKLRLARRISAQLVARHAGLNFIDFR